MAHAGWDGQGGYPTLSAQELDDALHNAPDAVFGPAFTAKYGSPAVSGAYIGAPMSMCYTDGQSLARFVPHSLWGSLEALRPAVCSQRCQHWDASTQLIEWGPAWWCAAHVQPSHTSKAAQSHSSAI